MIYHVYLNYLHSSLNTVCVYKNQNQKKKIFPFSVNTWFSMLKEAGIFWEKNSLRIISPLRAFLKFFQYFKMFFLCKNVKILKKHFFLVWNYFQVKMINYVTSPFLFCITSYFTLKKVYVLIEATYFFFYMLSILGK